MAILEPYIKQQIIDETSIPSVSDDSIVVGCLVDSDTGPSTITPMAGRSEFIKNYLEATTINAEDNTTIKHVAKLLQFTPVYVNRVQGGDVLVGKTNGKEDLFFDSDFLPYTQSTKFQFVKPANKYQYAYVVVEVTPNATFTLADGSSVGTMQAGSVVGTEEEKEPPYKAVVLYMNGSTHEENLDSQKVTIELTSYEDLATAMGLVEAPETGFAVKLDKPKASKLISMIDFGETAVDEEAFLFVKPTGKLRNLAMPTDTAVPMEDVFLSYNEIAASVICVDGDKTVMLPSLDRVTFESGYVNVSAGLKTKIPSLKIGGVCPEPRDYKINTMSSDYYLLGLARVNGDVSDIQLTDETEVTYNSYVTLNGASYHIQQPDGVVASYPTTDVSMRFFGDYNEVNGRTSYYSSGAVSPERFFIYLVDKQLERYFANPGVTAPSISTATLEIDSRYVLPSNKVVGGNDVKITTSTQRVHALSPTFTETEKLVDSELYIQDHRYFLFNPQAKIRYIKQVECVFKGESKILSEKIISSESYKYKFLDERIHVKTASPRNVAVEPEDDDQGSVTPTINTSVFVLLSDESKTFLTDDPDVEESHWYEYHVYLDSGLEYVFVEYNPGDTSVATICSKNAGIYLLPNITTETVEGDNTTYAYLSDVTFDYLEGSNLEYTKNYVSITSNIGETFIDENTGNRKIKLGNSLLRVMPTSVTACVVDNVGVNVTRTLYKFELNADTTRPNLYTFLTTSDVIADPTIERLSVSISNNGNYKSDRKFVSTDVSTITKLMYRVKEFLCSDMYKTSGNFGFLNKTFGITGKNMLIVPVLNDPNALYFRSNVETYKTNMPSGVVDNSAWGWTSFMSELSGSDSLMYEYNISGQLYNDNETIYENQWVTYVEYERDTKEPVMKYVFYNGEPNDLDFSESTITYVQLSSQGLTWSQFVKLLRSEMSDYFITTNVENGFALWSKDNTREVRLEPMMGEYAPTYSPLVIPDSTYITREEKDYRPVIDRTAFAVVSRYLSKTNQLGFTCVKNEDDKELYTLTLTSIVDGESTDYTISFVDDKVDGYGVSVYYNRVNNLNSRMYIWRKEGTDKVPGDIVNVDAFGSSSMVRVVRAEPEDYVKAIEKFKLFQGWYYTFIFDGGYVNTQVAKALAEMGDSIFCKALVTMPDIFDYKQLIEYRQATGIDTYEAKFIEPHFNDTTVGDFVSTLSPHCYHIEKVIANKSGGKEFAPVFGITNGSIVNVPKYRRLKQEQREALINQQINTVIYDQVRGLSYFNLDLSAQLRDSDLSDDNNVRLVNEITHVCDRELIYFIGRFNTTSTRDEVVATLTRAINERVVVNQSYTAKDIKVICDTTNNTQDIIRARKLVVDVEIWTQRGIRYIHVYHRVKNLEE